MKTISLDSFDYNSNGNKAIIELKVCLLPGLIGIPKVKDSFISSTIVLQIHKEDISKRAFHKRNVEEYKKLFEVTQLVADPKATATTC